MESDPIPPSIPPPHPGSTPPSGPDSTPPSRPAASAITSLILGILSILLAVACVGILPGLAGIGFGWFAHRRHPGSRTMAHWGVGVSILGSVLSVAMMVWVNDVARTIAQDIPVGGTESLTRWEGVPAPDLTVRTLSGQDLKLSDLKGKRVVLDFWATWCGPCVQEIPHFIQLYNETRRDQLEIVGISDEDIDVLRRFTRDKKIPYPIGNAVNPGAPYNQINAFPTTFFIDRRGVIQSVAVGYHDLQRLRAKALGPDTVGEPKAAPAEPPSGLQPADTVRQFKPVWNRSVPSAVTVAGGDWDSDGASDVLVAGGGSLLRLSRDGQEQGTLPWPAKDSLLEIGRTRSGEARIVTYSNWGKLVRVVDRAGQELWTHPSASGVDGAHWGDLDGDGDDELVVGHNGGGGLVVLGVDGALRWKVGGIGNVWCQTAIPARGGQPGRVLFTEASGHIRVYDAAGAALGQFQLDGRYCAAMNAAWMGPTDGLQVIGESGQEFVAVADASGEVRWRLPARGSPGNWRSHRFVAGDLTGDGTPEWILRKDNTLVVASAGGVQLGVLEPKDSIVSFAVLPSSAGPGRLAVLYEQLLIVYELQ